MKKHFVFSLLLFFVITAKAADLDSSETQSSGRGISSAKNINSIPLSTQKNQDSQYFTQQPAIQQYYPPAYQPQYPQQQPAMIVIAQPAQLQQQLLTTAAQQLLQYFHGNPQARVQFLQGNFVPNIGNAQPQPQPQPQPQYIPQPLPYYQLTNLQPQYPQYQNIPVPIPAHPISSPLQSQPSASYNVPQAAPGVPEYVPYPTGQFGHSPSLNHITALAQLSAQKFVPPVNYRTPPAIITGLENFTPEQQAQIKAQISSGQPITTPLKSSTPLNTSALQQLYSSQSPGKVQDNNNSQDQYQPNTNEDTKGTNQNYSNNNNNSNNYGSYGTKG